MDVPETTIDYRMLLRSSPNAYLVLTPDTLIADVSNSHLEMTELTREAVVGRPVFEVFPPPPGAEEMFRASFARVIETGKQDVLPVVRYPVEFATDNGVQMQNRYWAVTNAPIPDADGHIALILQSAIEITDLMTSATTDSARMRTADAMANEQQRMRQMMELAPGFFAVTRGPDHVIELANRAFYDFVGHRDNILGEPARNSLPELSAQGFIELLDQVYATGEPFVGRAVGVTFQPAPDEAPVERFTDFIYQPIFEDDGKISGIFVQGHDVSDAQLLSQEVGYQAAHDVLTGLLNRREFHRRLAAAVRLAKKKSICHALLYIDIDQFKVINDTSGHTAGDELLRLVSVLLQSRVRPSDALARIGGDEFGLLLENCPEETAERIANELRELVGSVEFGWQGRIFACSASIGLVGFGDDKQDMENLLGDADSACHLAKEKGRNRVQVHRAENLELSARRQEMEWVGRLREAIQEKRIRLYAQRIEALQPGNDDTERLEILIRLEERDGTLVPPFLFIPAAERYGSMPAIDRYVTQGAFEYLLALPDLQRSRMRLSVNLSGTTLNDDAFVPFVKKLHREMAISPEQICFEVTETTAIADLTGTAHTMELLKALGFRFALDDFGSGTSSLSYLKQLPVDYLKIDGVFIKNILTDPVDAAMVAAIARIAEVMGIQTVAEYVETDEIRQLLAGMGVDFGQGYGIHKPEPLECQPLPTPETEVVVSEL